MKTGEVIAHRFRVTGGAIGRGASGVVWPAVEIETERCVALKQLHSHLVSQPLAMARLRVEASTAGQVQHPHVLSVLGLWHHRGHDLLVSEYCDGPALETLPAHAQDVALAFAYQVATALEVAHLTGRVHGDVRPGNVLIGPDGAMLFDFGIATLLQKFDVIKDQFRPGQTAPEVQQGAPRSVRSDLYGVGVVLFFALDGHMPFDGPTPFAIVGRQRQGVPDVSRQANGVAALLRDLLQPNPVQRPRSVTAVIKALERLRRSPNRVISLGKNWLAPTRFRRSWIVHGIDPQTITKAVTDILAFLRPNEQKAPSPNDGKRSRKRDKPLADISNMHSDDLERLVRTLEEEMNEAAGDLRFEYAARLRDEIKDLKREIRESA